MKDNAELSHKDKLIEFAGNAIAILLLLAFFLKIVFF
jgi:hypothetical protein